MTSWRPLYHAFAWAYDAVVSQPGGPAAGVVVETFRRHGLGRDAEVVDAGCGTGGYALELARAGLAVTGIDRSPELVELAVAKARAAGSSARFEVADLSSWRPPRPAGGVLCRGVLNDLLGDAERAAAMAGLAGMLAPRGVLVLDVREWTASAARYAEAPVVERSGRTPRGTAALRSETAVDTARRLLRVRERIAAGGESAEFDFAMRPWTYDELELGLGAAGFGQIEISLGGRGRGDGGSGARSDRLVAVAVRRP